MHSHIRAVLLATVSYVALSNAAGAADAPIVTKAPASTPSWAGPYAGINVGGAWHDAKFNEVNIGNGFFIPSSARPASPSGSGLTAGAQVGYNWQNQNFVYGLEADLNWLDADKRDVVDFGGGFFVSASTKFEWLATLRARAGIVINPYFYVTGGLAIAGVENTWHYQAPSPGTFVSDKTRIGYVIGAGAEHMFAANRTARIELLYVDLGKATETPTLVGLPYRSEFRNTTLIVRGGLNLKW